MSATDQEELSEALNRAREGIIEELRALLAGRGDGIDLDTPFHWVVDGVKQPVTFFEHLPSLLPSDSILYVEGGRIAPEVAAFYSAHRARNAVDVARDTIWPVPDIYHFSFSSDVSSRLRQFAENRPVADMFDHLKAYRGETMLFYFHNAFHGTLRISAHIPEDIVAQFCRSLGVSFHRGGHCWRDPELLRKVLWSFEHPDQPKFPDEGGSWFSRIWRRWTGR